MPLYAFTFFYVTNLASWLQDINEMYLLN